MVYINARVPQGSILSPLLFYGILTILLKIGYIIRFFADDTSLFLKAWFRIHIMCQLKSKLDRKSFEPIYIAFIRPLLEYGDVIWDSCTQYEKNEPDKIQIEAAIITTGATKHVTSDILNKEVGW